MSGGLNRLTLRPLSGFAHVEQSLRVIWSTPLISRVMRRTFGNPAMGLLGRENLTPQTIMRFAMALILSCELWEPRFRIRFVTPPSDSNSAEDIEQGRFGLKIVGDYRPRALQGDFTVESVETISL